jgi:hypothetical protein
MLSATCTVRVRRALIEALDARLGMPVDSYVNGSQTWLTPDGPAEAVLEWRLHPVASYRRPTGVSHEDVWDAVVDALAAGESEDALHLGDETRPLTSLWEGLECYAAYGDELEPPALASAVEARLGIAPEHFGLVDHDTIGDEWERTQGAASIFALVVAQLTSPR